jgi:transposase
MPKRGPDKNKIKKIRKELAKNPGGLWTREISRRTGVSKSTVNRYLHRFMGDEIEEVLRAGDLIRVVRLKK